MPYLPPTSHITLLATLRRERLLPTRGEVVIRPGQRVDSGDVIAQAEKLEHYRLIDLARLLGVPGEHLGRYLLKQEGDVVKKGEPVVRRKTLLGLVDQPVVSPVDGRLALLSEGKALFAALSPLELRAGLPGEVVGTVPGRGAIIETTGALLEGIWGNGQEGFSVLRLLGTMPGAALPAAGLDLSLRGAIVAAGWVDEASLFKSLQEIGVRGLILGSAPAEQLPLLQALSFPVMVAEGFHTQGFSEPAYNLLAGNSGREVWLNAQLANRFAGARPEALILLPSPSTPPPLPPEGNVLAEGKRVRILRGPDRGRIGNILSLSERAVVLPNGVRAPVAAVALDEGKAARTTVTVPFANLELLE